jgi:hypothetical protein
MAMRRKIAYLAAAAVAVALLQWAVPRAYSAVEVKEEATQTCPADKKCPADKNCPVSKSCPKGRAGCPMSGTRT